MTADFAVRSDIDPVSLATYEAPFTPINAKFPLTDYAGAIIEQGITHLKAPRVQLANVTSPTDFPEATASFSQSDTPVSDYVFQLTQQSELAMPDLKIGETLTPAAEPDDWLKVPLVEGWQNQKVRARSYPLSQRDREVLNKTFNALYKQCRIRWAKGAGPFAHPVFVVWGMSRGELKGRVVNDLRGLNKVTVPDNYPPLSSNDEHNNNGNQGIGCDDFIGSKLGTFFNDNTAPKGSSTFKALLLGKTTRYNTPRVAVIIKDLSKKFKEIVNFHTYEGQGKRHDLYDTPQGGTTLDARDVNSFNSFWRAKASWDSEVWPFIEDVFAFSPKATPSNNKVDEDI
ncbi:hypothetical protein N657DRAFT_635228 [Parathielavia appendiculata]|uniref:Uncharacterized protein n=1 Tax=Parathielavia appendiculata TaxID=2587402 RepID=A0AAN6TXA6_9PEZI|nr:hypothetical protein N657DRAFT_635228 [Parathielavia appendiculata]